jgi:hypothetical protein
MLRGFLTGAGYFRLMIAANAPETVSVRFEIRSRSSGDKVSKTSQNGSAGVGCIFPASSLL